VKGGYQVQSRLATHLDEIRMEAMVAGASRSRRERDRAWSEIRTCRGETAGPRVDAPAARDERRQLVDLAIRPA
jgi:hypothetical protein